MEDTPRTTGDGPPQGRRHGSQIAPGKAVNAIDLVDHKRPAFVRTANDQESRRARAYRRRLTLSFGDSQELFNTNRHVKLAPDVDEAGDKSAPKGNAVCGAGRRHLDERLDWKP
jgi:hypothetical protein